MPLRFEWDKGKAEANLKKHGVTFSEACTVFADPLSITVEEIEVVWLILTRTM